MSIISIQSCSMSDNMICMILICAVRSIGRQSNEIFSVFIHPLRCNVTHQLCYLKIQRFLLSNSIRLSRALAIHTRKLAHLLSSKKKISCAQYSLVSRSLLARLLITFTDAARSLCISLEPNKNFPIQHCLLILDFYLLLLKEETQSFIRLRKIKRRGEASIGVSSPLMGTANARS